MGKFDGILICSDWDGTLHSENGVLNKDISAIRYFQKNGGLFTICSGRQLDHLKMFFDDVKPNTYVITLNGALIINPDTNTILHKGYIEAGVLDIAQIVVKELPNITNVMVYIDDDKLRYPMTRDEFIDSIQSLKQKNVLKFVLITKTEDDTKEAKNLINKEDLGEHLAVCSWSTGLEIIHKNNAKNLATERLKLATNSRLLITVGDHENDIEMLKSADISYAVDNASDYVKSFSRRVTCSVYDGAISKIIEEIESEI